MSDRLVLVPDQARERVEELARADHDLVGIRANRPRDRTRVVKLAERPLAESHRKRLERTIDHPRHQTGDHAAVQAARQKHPERHVAHQPETDRFLEPGAELGDDICIAEP